MGHFLNAVWDEIDFKQVFKITDVQSKCILNSLEVQHSLNMFQVTKWVVCLLQFGVKCMLMQIFQITYVYEHKTIVMQSGFELICSNIPEI